jgi:intein/homing endonuclease
MIEKATITNITEEPYEGFVYDLDIPEARNFAANGILVHDSTFVPL